MAAKNFITGLIRIDFCVVFKKTGLHSLREILYNLHLNIL